MAPDTRPGDRHRRNPVTFRPSEDDRAWLESHAEQSGWAAGAILSAALAMFRDRVTADDRPQLPPPAEAGGDAARAIARHAKAALLHLRQADAAAEAAGLDLTDPRDRGPDGAPTLAALFRAAGDAIEDLDAWAIGTAAAAGLHPRTDTYAGTASWCQAPGGALPAGSWLTEDHQAAPGHGGRPALTLVTEPAETEVDSERWTCQGCGVAFIGGRPRGADVELCPACTLAALRAAAAEHPEPAPGDD